MSKRPRKSAAPEPAAAPAETAALAAEIAALRAEVTRLNANRLFRIQNSYLRLLGFQLASGLALGLGTVLGATILVSIMAYFLSQIELMPIIGDWAAEILRLIEERRR